MIDRHNRKLMMMVSDLMGGLATVAILLFQAFGVLQIWHLYVAAIFQGLGNAFQWPAYSAAISTMIPKEKYGRANGMMALIEAGPGVLAPMLAGVLPVVGFTGILSIDVKHLSWQFGSVIRPHPTTRTIEGKLAQNLLRSVVWFSVYLYLVCWDYNLSSSLAICAWGLLYSSPYGFAAHGMTAAWAGQLQERSAAL
jgi:MFS family permease